MSTKTITPNQTFKHDGQTYESGESYEVESELAFYFKMNGWVGEKQPPSGEAVTLEVHDSDHGHVSEVK